MRLFNSSQDVKAKLKAINRSQAMIEFNLDGTIITANENFLNALGYQLDEIRGKHHSMFVDDATRNSAEYRAFWDSLRRGEYQARAYKRVAKGGRPIWIQASYNPLFGRNGKPFKVVKFATDITAARMLAADHEGQIQGIHKSQAVIEFNLDGTIITANDIFLGVVGYTLAEIQGKHHSMFVAPGERESRAYQEFWASLNRGEFQSAEYKRFGKGGKEVWILASYNPILDDTGKPFKVVKFASDISAQKLKAADFAGQIEAIGKSQAVIEFDMDGKVFTANQNFLGALGYSLAEIQGKHHGMFVSAEERGSEGYREFWASLNRGEFKSGEYRRFGKGGREVWIQASYNPIRDLNGKPYIRW
jgi:methyl-accepting chemotaxis protein